MQRLKIIILLLFIYFNLNAEEKVVNDFYIDIVNETSKILCKDKKTLSFIDMEVRECKKYISKISVNCNKSLKEIFPKFKDFDHALRNSNKIQYLTFMYISCLKSKIYESKIENKILSD